MKILSIELNEDYLSVTYVEDPGFLTTDPSSIVTKVVTVTVPEDVVDWLPQLKDDAVTLVRNLRDMALIPERLTFSTADLDDDDNDSMEIL